jgi:DNA-binding MarR family transcriptional regulator
MNKLAQTRAHPQPTLPTAAVRQRWREAHEFQARAQKVLANVGVPFIQWLLLESLRELNLEHQNAVSQARIAERSGLSRMVTSYWMIAMNENGLVDRGPDEEGRAYRIWLSNLGTETLRQCNERLSHSGVLG